jgi:hypothetical protein
MFARIRIIGRGAGSCLSRIILALLAWIPKEAKLTNNLDSRRPELSEDSRLAGFDLVIAYRE